MQRYGQICIVCYNCEIVIFSQMRAGRFSHKCNQKTADGAVGQVMLISQYPKHQFTFSGNPADQHVSFYIYN